MTQNLNLKLSASNSPFHNFIESIKWNSKIKIFISKQPNLNHRLKIAPQTVKSQKNNRKLYYQQHERNLQNNGLLRRINSAKTSYNSKELLAQRKQNEHYIQTISKFGFKHKKNNPFQFKIKTITQNSHFLMQTYRSSRASKAQLRNSHEKSTKFSEQDEFKVFQDDQNQVKSIERIKQRSPPQNEKRNHTQKS